jgi:hypothetical protein
MIYQKVAADRELNQVVEKSNLLRDGLDIVVPYKNSAR